MANVTVKTGITQGQYKVRIGMPVEYAASTGYSNGWKDGAYDADVTGRMYVYQNPNPSDYALGYKEGYAAHVAAKE